MADVGRIQHPIQVFLDTNQFIRVERKPAGGGNRDFFERDNAGFDRHKTRMRQQLRDIAESMEIEGQAAGFLIVQMREGALAKSYRPLSALFTPSHRFALVGGGKPGEMFFQSTPQGLRQLDTLIDQRAELRPREVYNEKSGKVELRVSAYRSELEQV